MKTKVLNKYNSKWLILLPIKGKSTKRDVTLLNKKNPFGGFTILGVNNFMVGRFFVSKKDAENQLKKLKGLGKPYSAYIITDAQLGKMEIDYVKKENKLFITDKQKKAVKIVK